jgi:hypothetical protein
MFKSQIPTQLLVNLFDKNFIKTKDFYIINNISFKKGIYNNTIQEFLEICRKYYHVSKQKYIDKPLTYNSFITVIRQICKYNKIQYKNEKAIHNLTHSFFHGDSQLHPDVIIDILVNTVVVAVTI